MSRITQRGATGPLAIQANGDFQTSTDSDLVTLVGTRWDLSDGREAVLVSASSATTVAPGKLYQNAPLDPLHQNLAVTAFQAYSNNGNVPAKVTVTLGANAVTANQYRGGFLVVNDVTGEGQTLRIASHPAAVASASLAITLEDGPNVDLTTSSEVCLIPAPGKDIVINPIVATNVPVGIALSSIAASAYGFVIAKGVTSALSDASAPAVGVAIAASTATAGAISVVGLNVGSGFVSNTVIGNTVQAAVSTEYRTVSLNL